MGSATLRAAECMLEATVRKVDDKVGLATVSAVHYPDPAQHNVFGLFPQRYIHAEGNLGRAQRFIHQGTALTKAEKFRYPPGPKEFLLPLRTVEVVACLLYILKLPKQLGRSHQCLAQTSMTSEHVSWKHLCQNSADRINMVVPNATRSEKWLCRAYATFLAALNNVHGLDIDRNDAVQAMLFLPYDQTRSSPL
ncbi:hypothetical protein SELMODRAFT_429994 [Selaginella moellendorffii]|uniref:Uncharacterized protein n=1 Tax=Selaginella moellendorffii TaxID=88036 RepID=D8T7Z8_SELML|nr:hypothetical protein SELMODRAFT_429994 [Selaginella moellendorffii]